jgi:hypothetical protein
MPHLPACRWKNDTGLDLPSIAQRLYGKVLSAYTEIQQLKRLMKESTGEVRNAYTLVIHDRCWNLQQEYWRLTNALIGATMDLEYAEDNGQVETREYCTGTAGPTGATINPPDPSSCGCNGPADPALTAGTQTTACHSDDETTGRYF